jgi:hypothetical protein
MMTPAQRLAFLDESAAEDLKWARIAVEKANWPLVIQNYGQAVTHCFERALLGWRTGLIDPTPDLHSTVEVSEAAVTFLEATDVGPLRSLFDPSPGAYGAVLVDRQESPALAETRRFAVRPPPLGLTVDRTLEGWLVGTLVARDPGAGPELAAELQSRKRTALLGETYVNYFALAALSKGDAAKATQLTQLALELFARRKRDAFYSGGVAFEGGGPDNDFVVDFHLAAIWHVLGWDPSALTLAERLHVQLPSAG